MGAVLIEWVLWIAIFFSIVSFIWSLYSGHPHFMALAGVFLFLTSLVIFVDGGVDRETGYSFTYSDGDIVSAELSYTTVPVTIEENPLFWGFNTALMFLGFSFLVISLGTFFQTWDRFRT